MVENGDLLRQVEEAEGLINQLNKIKISLSNQLEDTRRLADEECRVRSFFTISFLSVIRRIIFF